MPRNINPAPQYTVGLVPLSKGEMYYFETGSNKPKATFADSSEEIENRHPVILDGDGRLPNVFFSGVAKQTLTKPSPFTQGDGRGEQVFSRDPVGQQSALSAFDAYSAETIYQLNSIVTTSDGRFWKSLVNDNVRLSPITDNGDNWQEIDFKEFYAKGVTFKKLDSVISVIDGLTYISVVDNNKDKEPSVDNGTNWELDEPVLLWVTGRTYAIGDKAVSKIDNREYKAVTSQAGNEPSADDGTKWLPTDGVVVKPVNTSPVDLSTGVSRNPTLSTNAYSVEGSSAEQFSSEFLLSDDGFATIFYTSDITGDLTDHIVTLKLPANTLFDYKMRKTGVRTNISEFSDVTTFTTVFPLSDSFSNDLTEGNGVARTLANGVDLSSQSGIAFIANIDTADPMRLVSTQRGVGVATHVGVFDDEFVEATGLISFNINGYSVGALTAYNGNLNDIFSLTLQQISKFIDVVAYIGNQTIRSISHNLGVIPGTYITVRMTGGVGNTWFTRYGAESTNSRRITFGDDSNSSSDDTIFNSIASTSSVFQIGASVGANATGESFLAILIANSVSSGVVSGTYTGTASSGNKITTTFKPSTIIAKNLDTNEDWLIFDLKLGTSEHIALDATAQRSPGSVQSFDSDGFTLTTSLGNTSGDEYYYIAFADTSVF